MESGWVAVGFSAVVTLGGAVGSHFVMGERVRRVAKDVETKIDRREFDLALERLNDLHTDLRQIRDLLMQLMSRQPGAP